MAFFRSLALLLCAALIGAACSRSGTPEAKPALTVYCAAGLRKPLEAVAREFEAECGVSVHFQFGGTGTLLSQIRVAGTGDLFVAADDQSVALARKDQLCREVIPFVVQTPVLAVQTGNPHGIRGFDDLLRTDLRVAVANPESASIGKNLQTALGGRWDALLKSVTVMKPTVTEIAADLSLKAVDLAVVWDSLISQFQGLEAVHVPELDARAERASMAVLSASTQSARALQFARFLAAPERGTALLKGMGFTPIAGDAWAPKPELVLYSGGVNRPAIEGLLKEFATREGVGVTTVFNGCGVLCATMKTMDRAQNPKYPDAYYACDMCFVPPVAEEFPEAVLLTETNIGIVVRAGNPKGIRSLADLAQPGVRVGLCNAEQSTLGYMTRGILKSAGLSESIRRNVVVEVPTADFLVNQMRAGALDAAVVYEVNAQASKEELEFQTIRHEGAKAMQPFAVRAHSPNRELALRLLAFLKEHRSEFEKAGFAWRGEEAPIQSKAIVVPEWLKEK